MFKKMMVLMLVLILSMGTLIACGGAKDNAQEPSGTGDTGTGNEGKATELAPEEGATLKIWTTEGPELEQLKVIGEKFTEKYGVPVEYEPVALADTAKKIQQDGPAGLGADVFEAPHDHVGNMVQSGVIYANDVSDPAGFLEAAVTGTTLDDTWYGWPTAIETYALFYNKDLVGDKLPKTWDDVKAFAKGYNDIKNDKYAFMMETGNFYFQHAFIGGFGGYVFGENGTNPEDIGLNNDGAVEALKFARSLREILPLNNTDITYDIKGGLFNEGKLAFDMNGPWAVAGYREAGVNFGVMPLPTLPNGEHPQSFSGIRSLFVSSFTKYPNAAKLFADFATNQENALARFEAIGQIPPRADLADNEKVKNDTISAAFLEQAGYAIPMPSIAEMQSVWEPMGQALATNWDDASKDPKAILDDAVNKIKEAISSKK